MSKEQNIMPLPWTVELSDSSLDPDCDAWVIDCEQGSVAEVQCPADQAEQTARFIVRAVNSHEALIDSLNNMIDLWKRFQKNDRNIEYDSQVIEARAALALAEK